MEKRTGFIKKIFDSFHKEKEKMGISQQGTKKSKNKKRTWTKDNDVKKEINLSKVIDFKQSFSDVMEASDDFDNEVFLTDDLCAKDIEIYMQINLDKIKDRLEQEGITHIDIETVGCQRSGELHEINLLVVHALCNGKESSLIFDQNGNFTVDNHDQTFCDFAKLVSNELQKLCIRQGVSILPTIYEFTDIVWTQANWLRISDVPAECIYFNAHKITIEQIKENIYGTDMEIDDIVIDLKYNGTSFYKGTPELFAKDHVSRDIYGDINDTILDSLGYKVIDDRVTMSITEDDLDPDKNYDPEEEDKWNLYLDRSMLAANYYDDMISDFYDSFR